MLFEKKKIKLETLSEYLREARQSLNLPLEKVSRQTQIKEKFLKAFEDGNFFVLPPDVYVFGFLRQLSLLYSVDAEVLIEQYKKERNIQMHLARAAAISGSGWWRKYFQHVVITPRSVSVAAGLLFAFVTAVYVIWQVLSINKTPDLVILTPQDRQMIRESFVSVEGKTDPGAKVTVNDQEVFVDFQGHFKTQLGLSAGPKEVVIVAKNKFDKEAARSLSVTGVSGMESPDSPLRMKLEFSGDVSLTFAIDQNSSQTITFHSGDIKTLSATRKIILSTTDAGSTKVTLNDQALGAMGRPGEKLHDVPFFAESNNANK